MSGRRRGVLAFAACTALVAAACSGGGTSSPETVVSIVEVPGEAITVTSIVTQTSIVEVTAAPTTTEPDPRAGWPGTLILGVPGDRVSDRNRASFEAIAAALSAALDLRVLISTSPDAAGIADAVAAGQVDLAPFRPQEYVAASERHAGLELLAQSVQFGDATYHGQWFTNDPGLCGSEPVVGAYYYDESGHVVLVDASATPALQVGWNVDGTRDEGSEPGLVCPEPVDVSTVIGKTIAFTTETSSIGFILPTLQLREAGISNSQYTSLLAGGHELAVAAVYEGGADVGVSYDDARRALGVADAGSKVIVFNLTPRAGNDVLVVRAGLPPSLTDAVFDALLSYIRTEDGRSALSTALDWTDVKRADEVTVASLETVAAAMRELGFTG